MKMRRTLAVLLSLALLAGCGRDAGRAKSDLLKMSYEFTPEEFIRAARAGDEKAVELFLDGGMNVNAATADGSTALIGAAENNATQVIRLLEKQGAAHNQKDREGWTPLMKAVYANKAEAVALLAEGGKEDLNRGLLLAAMLGNTASAQALLKAGAEVDATSPEGTTSLAYARKAGNADLEKILLQAGAEAVAAEVPARETLPNRADRQALLKDVQALRASDEEAWWKKYGLDLQDAAIFSQDGDRDGFTNSEEFLADTSPVDPSSHPAAAAKLIWQGYSRERLPVALEKVENETANLVDDTGASVPVKVGETVAGWTVKSVRSQILRDKDGTPYDGSDVTISDATGRKVRLVPGIRPDANTSFAEVRLPFADGAQHLRAGEEFGLPDDGNRRYVVLDLREDQVVVRETKTGQTFTIAKP